MQNAGTALMAVGEARGEGRAVAAARAAITSPLLDVSIDGAEGVLLNVSGGPDLTLAEVTEAAETIQAAVDPDANIFFGAVIHPAPQDEVRVTVIATGLKDARGGNLPAQRRPTLPDISAREPAPEPRSRLASESVSPPRERPIVPASRVSRIRTPAPSERHRWERERPRTSTPPPDRATTTGTCPPSCAARAVSRAHVILKGAERPEGSYFFGRAPTATSTNGSLGSFLASG